MQLRHGIIAQMWNPHRWPTSNNQPRSRSEWSRMSSHFHSSLPLPTYP